MEQNNDTKPSFVPDYRIAKLSGIGIVGFIIGCVILFYPDFWSLKKNDSVFHEIKYQPRLFVAPLIAKTIDSLNNVVNQTKQDINRIDEKDSSSKEKKVRLLAKKDADTTIIKQLSTYKQYYEDVAELDTLGFKKINNALHFQITSHSINKWDNLFCKKKYRWKDNSVIVDSVDCYLKDEKIPFAISGKFLIKAEKSDSDIGFITKYPSTGIWLMLILVFCSFCFIAISTSVYLKGKVEEIFKEEKIEGLPGNSYDWICFFTALVMAFILLVWNRSFYDDDIVKNLYFLKNLSISMYMVIALGSLAGAFCLAGFIYTASMLSYFVKPLIKIRNEVNEQKLIVQKSLALTATTNTPTTPPTPEQLLLEAKETEQRKQESIFNKLVKKFQTYFLLAAIILSLMVLCTGALFSTINSLDFIKLIDNDWGYSPVRSDFIYLYGGLYTIILLLVYIPAKMRFSEVDIWSDQTTTTGNAKWFNILKSPFGQLKDVLVATSPLLVSIIQSLFDALFN